VTKKEEDDSRLKHITSGKVLPGKMITFNTEKSRQYHWFRFVVEGILKM